jgi:hypothetical protein
MRKIIWFVGPIPMYEGVLEPGKVEKGYEDDEEYERMGPQMTGSRYCGSPRY